MALSQSGKSALVGFSSGKVCLCDVPIASPINPSSTDIPSHLMISERCKKIMFLYLIETYQVFVGISNPNECFHQRHITLTNRLYVVLFVQANFDL